MRFPEETCARILLAAACFLWSFSNSAAIAGELASRSFRIPVFFITDRNLQPDQSGEIDFGPHRKYIGDCKHDPFMGSAWCVVENFENKPLTDRLKELGWSEAEPNDKLASFKATPISADNFDAIEREFYETVHKRALVTDDKNLLVFAHGYKNSFRAALSTAAKLAYYAERPLILYSWPSVAKLRSYTTDENNVEWSQEHFNEVIGHLERLCSEDPTVKVRLFAHSMGTRLLVRATPLLSEKHYVLEAALICPDVDDGLVKHYARRYLSVNGTMEIRLYMSQRDKALALSQVVHGGYTRLGEQADALGGWVANTLSGQKTTAEEEEKKGEDGELADKLSKTKGRMQTIDFTNIDKGLIGHNVPAKLICNMSFTGTPGPGLELVQEESGQRSRISNAFTKMAKLKTSDGSTPTGAVLRVVKDTPDNKGHLQKAAMQPAQ